MDVWWNTSLSCNDLESFGWNNPFNSWKFRVPNIMVSNCTSHHQIISGFLLLRLQLAAQLHASRTCNPLNLQHLLFSNCCFNGMIPKSLQIGNCVFFHQTSIEKNGFFQVFGLHLLLFHFPLSLLSKFRRVWRRGTLRLGLHLLHTNPFRWFLGNSCDGPLLSIQHMVQPCNRMSTA